MNINDLPPAAKLAALIEAGRAANPDLKLGHGRLYDPCKQEACALGYACLGAGIARNQVQQWGTAIRLLPEFSWDFQMAVATQNDRGATLDEIIQSLREGELAKVSA
jgi:hypothetical protein